MGEPRKPNGYHARQHLAEAQTANGRLRIYLMESADSPPITPTEYLKHYNQLHKLQTQIHQSLMELDLIFRQNNL